MLSYDVMALIITLLGTMFLIGELLVKMKGLFGLVGIGLIITYFSVYLNLNITFIMLLVYIIGLFLIIIDGKFINDGTLGVIGAAAMLASVGLSAPNWGAGLYSMIGVILGGVASLLFLRVFKRRHMWTKITLVDQLSSEMGYNSLEETHKRLVGRNAKALTDMRPSGTIRVDGMEYSALSNGQWVSKNEQVTVISVDGTKILVKKTGEGSEDKLES